MSLIGQNGQKPEYKNRPKFFRFKKFLSFYKPYRLLFAADIICASITTLAALALPLCIRYITNEVLASGASEAVPQIFRTLGIMLVLIVIQVIAGIFYDYKGHVMGAKMERDMREELFRHCQRLPVNFFDKEKTGALMSRITNDLLNLAETCHHGPEFMFISLISFFGAFIVLFRIDARLSAVIILLLPLMILYTIFFHGRLRKAYRENRKKIGELNAGLEDTLSGIRVVKSFTNEKLEDAKFHRNNELFCQGRINIYRNEAFYYSVMEYFLVPLILVGVVAAGGLLITRSSLSVPDLIVFLLYIGYLTSPLTRVAQQVGMYQDGIAGFGRFMDILDLDKEDFLSDKTSDRISDRTGVNSCQTDSGQNLTAQTQSMPIRAQDSSLNASVKKFEGRLEFVDVSFKYGTDLENVLENFNINIKRGESVALVGFSGVGKTTLCSLIPRFYEVSSGKILLDGINVSEMDLHDLRRNIGVVAQDVYLFNGTVYDNIRYGKPGTTEEEIKEAAKRANAHDFIMGLPKAYETEIGQRGIRLSGGQRQRLSIARMFLKDPPVLILDEATSALDYESERLIHESLENFMKDRTTVIVAHRLSTVRKAKRIISLTERSVEELSPDRWYADSLNDGLALR